MAKRGLTIQVIGSKKLEKRFKAMSLHLQRRALDESAEAGAKLLQNAIRSRAPLGPTGNLRKDVRAKRKTKRKRVQRAARWEAGAYAAHSHLVEYGTRKRRIAKGRGMPIASGVVRKAAGPMPAKPFFRPAVHTNKRHALTRMSRVIGIAVAREFRKKKP